MNAEQYTELNRKLLRASRLRRQIDAIGGCLACHEENGHLILDGAPTDELPLRICLYSGSSPSLSEGVISLLRRWLDEAKAELEAL